jgi:hypothetical protein
MLRAANCKLGISNEINTTQSRWNVLQPGSEISNSTLVHQYDADANAVATLILWSNATYNFNSCLKLVNCRSVIDSSDANIAPTGAAISGSTGVPPAHIGDSVLEIINHAFDPRFEISVYAERCGTVKIIGGELAGRSAAVHYVSGTTAIGQALDCTIDSPDVSKVTGALITGSWNDVDQSAAKAYLRLRGEWKGYNGQPLVTNANSTPTVSRAQLQIKSNRRVLAGATPASGLLGDIVELEGPALAGGSTDSYRCTVSDASAATWNARTALAA